MSAQPGIPQAKHCRRPSVDELQWQERALCRECDPELFFPPAGSLSFEAKRICGMCDVRAQCLDYAITHGERHGIWGGLSERKRHELERRRMS